MEKRSARVEREGRAPLREESLCHSPELARAQLPEVFGSLGGDVRKQLHLDPAGGRAGDGDVWWAGGEREKK